ncbi:MAG: XdhC family protein [Gammaproteobacteria bacterium]|nr:XdhC family protein [Gammaproteobacteria bacterium]
MSIYSTDREILQTAIDWLELGHRVALVTVAKTWGSSPRPCGSMLAMREDGIHAGSVSGGCIEEDLVSRYRQRELTDRFPNLINYGVDRQDALRFGMPCGGRLELVVEQLVNAEPLKTLLSRITSGQLIARRVCMNTGEVSLHNASDVNDFRYTHDEMIKVFGPTWHILLIGAGHLTRYVASIALMLDYNVTVCDPREGYRAGWDMESVNFTHIMPDDAVKQIINQHRTILITLAHDPKLDDMALMEALTDDIFYVGALGSKRSNDQRRERLRQLGVTEQQLARLHAPVGLAIGSHTPPEIAVAIMAEITAARNNVLQTGAQGGLMSQ